MSKLRKLKEIESFKPRLETIYQKCKAEREKALEVSKNTPEEIKKPTKYDLKR